MKHLERYVDWDEETKSQSTKLAEDLEKHLASVDAVGSVTKILRNYWGSLHDGSYDAKPQIGVVATEFEQLIRDLTLRFYVSPTGGQRKIDELSEGQISLLYFALSATYHSLVRGMPKQNGLQNIPGFKLLDIQPAPLKIFAFEEPENHLAPFYLPRLVELLQDLIDIGAAQSLVTSHSPSVLRHICPRDVRYFRNCRNSLVTTVRRFSLPEYGTAEFNFLRQVILANPEIYFARLVIIGEGESERIVIPRIAKAMGFSMDPSFVAYVPIGGRHAKHLWKIVRKLEIPCLTLLDFDLGRSGGGAGRIKDAVNWLKEAGSNFDNSLGNIEEDMTLEGIKSWLLLLRERGVFYSTPLDFDMMLLKSFPEAYRPTREFNESKDDPEAIGKAVFGKNGPKIDILKRFNVQFSPEELFTYNNLFKSRSKPSSHYNALSSLDDDAIRDSCPKPLRVLFTEAMRYLSSASSVETELEE